MNNVLFFDLGSSELVVGLRMYIKGKYLGNKGFNLAYQNNNVE